MSRHDIVRQLDFAERVEKALAVAKAENALEVAGDPITVRIPRAKELLGIGRSKLYELIGEGEIDTIKVGSSTLVVVTSLKAFVLRQRGILPLEPIGLRELARLCAENSEVTTERPHA